MKRGDKVRRIAGGSAFITDITPSQVTVRFPNGRLHGMTHSEFKKNYVLL